MNGGDLETTHGSGRSAGYPVGSQSLRRPGSSVGDRDIEIDVSPCGTGRDVLRACAARLVHASSDALFSGGSYDESAMPDPVSPYGAAKAAAETAVRAVAPEAVIARTSLILDNDSPTETLVHRLAGRRVPTRG